jgi:hypothetical protein
MNGRFRLVLLYGFWYETSKIMVVVYFVGEITAEHNVSHDKYLL